MSANTATVTGTHYAGIARNGYAYYVVLTSMSNGEFLAMEGTESETPQSAERRALDMARVYGVTFRGRIAASNR